MKKLKEHLGLIVAPAIWGIFADLSHGDILGFFLRVIIIYLMGISLLYVSKAITSIILNK